jgi:hypothetical protein
MSGKKLPYLESRCLPLAGNNDPGKEGGAKKQNEGS